MPSQVTNYKCPACGGPLRFAGDAGKLKCDYCESVYELADIEKRMADAEAKAADAFQQEAEKAGKAKKSGGDGWDTSELDSDWGADAAGMKTYSCPSCGAELICEEATAATCCPYCGNNTVVPGQFSGALKPDYVIPFKLDKNAAVEALKKHYKGKYLLPKTFSKENHIEEVQGVYVPFWLFDGKADADIQFHATQESSHRDGKYEVTTTRHYDVRRAGSVEFERIPVDASKRMPDDFMDSIEPFDYGDLKPFSTAYLPGFLADRYDVSVEECAPRADERCSNTIVEMLKDTVTGYTTCSVTSKSVTLKRGKVHYALLPVWMLSTKWRGKNFLFAMNAQSGKMVGDLPVNWVKFWLTFAGIFGVLGAASCWFFLT
jgi:uncharacterized Zn finger protein (UPF0148 family)